MLQRAAGNGREISREDFYNIMTKKTFWLFIHTFEHFYYSFFFEFWLFLLILMFRAFVSLWMLAFKIQYKSQMNFDFIMFFE